MANRIKGITIELNGDATGLNKALEGVNKKLRTANEGLRDVNKLLKLDSGNVDLLRQKQDYLNDAISSTKDKLKTEREALDQLKHSDGFDANSEKAKALERQIIDDEQKLESLENELKNFGSVGAQQIKAVGDKFKEVGDKIKGVGDKIKGIGDTMTKTVTAPIAGIAAASVVAWQEVDAAMDTVTVKTGATGEALADMQERVKSIAETIPTDFQMAADAVGEVNTRFGATGEQLEQLSTQFIQFATLNETDVSSSIDTVQAMMAAWSLTAEDATNVLDLLNKAGQDTGIDVLQLASTLQANKTVLDEMGLSVSDAAMFLANLDKNGVSADAAMAGLRKALQNATADGKTTSDAISELQDALGNASNKTEAYATATELFGSKAGAAIADACMEGRLSFEELGTSLDDFAGNVSDTFNETLDPLDQMQVVMNTLKDTGADLVEVAGPMLADMMQKLTDIVKEAKDTWDRLDDSQKLNIEKCALMVAAIGPVISIVGTAIGTVMTMITSIGSLISVIGTVVGVLGGPLTLAIGAAIAAGVAIIANWDKIKDAAHQLVETVKNAFQKIREFIKLPHFSISGEFSLMPPSVPYLNVEWYRKAYDNGVLFNRPTVLQTPSGPKGFGEAGSEIVLGLNRLRELVGSGQGTTINVYGAPGQSEDALARIILDKITQIEAREAIGAL